MAWLPHTQSCMGRCFQRLIALPPSLPPQVLVIVLSVFLLSLADMFYPYNRGAMLSATVVLYALTAGIAGACLRGDRGHARGRGACRARGGKAACKESRHQPPCSAARTPASMACTPSCT